jgi:Uma2 family endonuclease
MRCDILLVVQSSSDHDDTIVLPRTVLRFPVELRTPGGFQPDDPATWPDVPGRLEYVHGRLLYMPPCADYQRFTAVDVTTALRVWSRTHAEFVVGGNEAGMRLGGDTRAADAAVWRVADHGPLTGKLGDVPPVLAVEVAGEEESEAQLRTKASWYLDQDVVVVWLVLPRPKEVVVLTRGGESRHGVGDHVAPHPALPGLAPEVAELFSQLDRLR